MLLTRYEPDDVTRPDLLHGPALTLNPAEARHDEQCLAKRMRVPRGACTRLKGDQSAGHTR
jgi:hypothetical protein